MEEQFRSILQIAQSLGNSHSQQDTAWGCYSQSDTCFLG